MSKEFTPTERRFLQEAAKHRDMLRQDIEDAQLIVKIDQHRTSDMIDSQRCYLENALYHINAAYDSLDTAIKGMIVGEPKTNT